MGQLGKLQSLWLIVAEQIIGLIDMDESQEEPILRTYRHTHGSSHRT